MLSGNDAHEITGLVTMQYQCFKDLFYILSQAGGNVYGTQIFFIHFVRDEFIGNLRLIEQPCCIRFINFGFFHHKIIIFHHRIIVFRRRIFKDEVLLSETSEYILSYSPPLLRVCRKREALPRPYRLQGPYR